MITNWHRVDLAPPPETSGVHLYNNKLYHGNPQYPQTGDVRIWYETAGGSEPGQEDKVHVNMTG